MKKLTMSFLFPLIAMIMLILVLDRQVFSTPPLGRFLNPFIGAVQNEQGGREDKTIELGLKKDVEVRFDKRDVPHLFAANQNDLFFAQGFVCASDRLWQMDFLSYVSAGRLSEILGKDLLEHDRVQRRNGMLESAKKSLVYIEQNAESKKALDNYTAGVNAWIHQLSYKDYPVEYKLMDYEPETWTNLKSVLIIKYMSAILSGYDDDLPASYARLTLGKQTFNDLFPNYFLEQSPTDFFLNKIADSLPEKEYLDYSFLESNAEISSSKFNPHLGSNSWAIGAQKSATGNAILCADPHLNLSLPSIWYEIQLKSNEQNVYGYSIPGVPGIIVGFNDQLSWGLTNASTDVRDYHKLLLKKDYSSYMYDGKWRKTTRVIEEIKVKNDDVFYDTVFYAHQGPIFSDLSFGNPDIRGFAIDWALHDPSNELLAFLQINKAKNNDQFVKAIRHYKCPVQNFSYADVEGNIGMYFQGNVLKRAWRDQGKFILNGSRSDHFTTKTLEDLPFSYNPAQGYVYSANNNPFEELGSTLIYGNYSECRADKIDAILKSKKKFNVKELQAMQLNNTNRMAEIALPVLLNASQKSASPLRAKFKNWNGEFTGMSQVALSFNEWWLAIRELTWDEFNRYKKGLKQPDDLVLLELIAKDPKNAYFDLQVTEKVETANDIIALALKRVEKEAHSNRTWGEFNTLKMSHLSNIDQFSRLGIKQSGHPDAINAFTNQSGPALRMIVEMSKRPQGYGIYGGGQTGNPGSLNYQSFVDDWLNGHYYKLDFYKDARDAKAGHKWILN
jgi:penicillin G amidase